MAVRELEDGNDDGTRLGRAATSKVSFFGAEPIVQPSSTGNATGFTAGSGTGVNDVSTFTGGTGTTAYRVNDIVRHLKLLGILAP